MDLFFEGKMPRQTLTKNKRFILHGIKYLVTKVENGVINYIDERIPSLPIRTLNRKSNNIKLIKILE